MNVSPPSRNEWPGVILHLLFTALGCAISLGMLFAIGGLLTIPHPNPSSIADSIFNPVFWVPSFFLGGLINRFVRHRWASFAPAVIGAFTIVGVMCWDVSLFRHSAYELSMSHGHLWRYEFGRMFATVSSFSPDKPDRTLNQLFVTFPFLSSTTYSLGAWAGFKFGKDEPVQAATTTNK